MVKLSTAEFLTIVAPQAIAARNTGSPLLPSVRLAQNILETGGNLNEHNNLGGFKVGSGRPNEWWRGATYTTPTWEVVNGKRIETVATWRSYSSVYDFYRDQDRLFQSARYARVRAATTPELQAQALLDCGYATDPQYAVKLINLIARHGLKKYDLEEADQEMTKEEKQAFDVLREEVASMQSALEAATTNVPAPDWFIREFGSADLDGRIHEPKLTAEGWRLLAIGLRVLKQ